jgi:hypothetical protein
MNCDSSKTELPNRSIAHQNHLAGIARWPKASAQIVKRFQ